MYEVGDKIRLNWKKEDICDFGMRIDATLEDYINYQIVFIPNNYSYLCRNDWGERIIDTKDILEKYTND